MAQVTTVVALAVMLAFVLLFKDTFSTNVAKFFGVFSPTSSDLQAPSSPDVQDAGVRGDTPDTEP